MLTVKDEMNKQSIYYIDLHSHILPEVDDGSQSVEESVKIAQDSLKQGICCIVATPHFYASTDHPAHFLGKRERSLRQLTARLYYSVPLIIPGAEVQYFEGITGMKELAQMRIAKSPGLLLEMPFCPWSERMIQDILDINSRPGYCVILAHIERYLRWQKDSVFEQLAEAGIRMQVNANFFNTRSTAGKAFRLLDRGWIHMLGSDCHNMTSRPPNLREACDIIAKKRGTEAVHTLMNHSMRLLLEEIPEERKVGIHK